MNNLNDYIFCIVGKSGCGKTTIANKLFEQYGYTQIASYTTRPPRTEHDTDHVFVSQAEYDALENKVAFTHFGNYDYCATKEQVDNANLYVIDPFGLKQLKQLYDGHKQIVSIYVYTPMETCLDRMRRRGDDEDKVWGRLRHDDEAFKGVRSQCEFVINGIPESAWFDVASIIERVVKHGILLRPSKKGTENEKA